MEAATFSIAEKVLEVVGREPPYEFGKSRVHRVKPVFLGASQRESQVVADALAKRDIGDSRSRQIRFQRQLHRLTEQKIYRREEREEVGTDAHAFIELAPALDVSFSIIN